MYTNRFFFIHCFIYYTKAVVCGSHTWKDKNRKAYGIATSLYDQHPVKKTISGKSALFTSQCLLFSVYIC